MEILSLSDTEFGRARIRLAAELERQIPKPMVFVGNAPDALPPAGKAELVEHTADPSVYEGRTPLIAGSYMQPNTTVIMQNRPFDEELKTIHELCSSAGIPTPNVVVTNAFEYTEDDVAEALSINKEDVSFMPFIRTDGFPQDGVDARPFNDKALMRQLMKQGGLEKNIVAGNEVIFNGSDTLDAFVNKIATTIDESDLGSVRVKLASSASGMSTLKVDVDRFKNEDEYRKSIMDKLPNVFKYKDQIYLDHVVIEENIDFGNTSGYSDFGLRGFILPDGQFFTTSIGKVVCEEGVYRGMIMVQAENLSNIGISYKKFAEARQVMESFAMLVSQHGYSGPVNLDIFIDPNGDGQPLVHDFNERDGGSSASGGFAYFIGGQTPVVDVDLKLHTTSDLSEDEANNLIANLRSKGVVSYATTFLRHPMRKDGQNIYTLKVMAAIDNACITDEDSLQSINMVADKINSVVNVGEVDF